MDLAMEGQALRRIAVMLVALAGLAERAAGRPHPLRGFVLWLLHRAEAVAQDFVIEELQEAGASMPPASVALRQGGDSPAEAMRLALCLRALASALDCLAARAGRLGARLDPDRAAKAAGLFSGAAPPHHADRRVSENNAEAQYSPIQPASNYPDTS